MSPPGPRVASRGLITPSVDPEGDVHFQLPFASKALMKLSPVSATRRTLSAASQVTPITALTHVEFACVLLHLTFGAPGVAQTKDPPAVNFWTRLFPASAT